MSNPVYPTNKLYIDLDNDNIAETDFSSRIVSAIDGESGIFSYKDTERLSSVGNLRFEIDNSDGAYTDSTSLVGKAVKATVTLGGKEKQVWFGYITNAIVDSGEWGTRRVAVTALDWMNISQKTRVQNIPLATFLTADESIPTLLDTTPNPPAYTDFEEGFESFPTMFDGALQNTVIYSELDKITKSELGYLFLRFRDNINGETLTFEDYLHRGSIHPLSSVPEGVGTPIYVKWANASDSGNIKWANASDSGLIKLLTLQQAYFDRTMVDSQWEIGQNVINEMSVKQIPRHIDDTVVTLYSLGSPIPIGTSQKYYLTAGYSDPNGGNVIQAFDIVTPVATIDFIFNEEADGSGADLTTNLVTSISPVFLPGANSFTIGFFNKGPAGYLILLDIRGKGIYKYNPVETFSEDVESQESIVKTPVSDSITREYSNEFNVSKTFADGVIAVNRTPIKVMKTVSFIGNTSEHLMSAFMYLEQGDKVQIVESEPSHTGNYYIQGIKFKLDVNGIVYFTWYLKEDVETICEPIAVRSGLEPSMVGINFGILPYLANLQQFSFSLWVKRMSNNTFAPLLVHTVDEGTGRRGCRVQMNQNGKITFRANKVVAANYGLWETVNNITNSGIWNHVVVTYNNTSDTFDPTIWINGASVAITETNTPVGAAADDSDAPLILFNIGPDPLITPITEFFYNDIRDVALKDVRIYNRILTSGEVNILYTGEDDYSLVKEGLLFNGIYAPRDNRDDYIDATITSDDLVLDSVHRATGIPYNQTTISGVDYMLYGLELT